MNAGIDYAVDEYPSREELVILYKSVGWDQANAPDELYKAVSQSSWVATASHQGLLVGLARVLTDGVYAAHFQEMLVHPDYQHQGVGKGLLDLYDSIFGDFRSQIAVTGLDWAKQKLEKRGFRAEPAALSRSRPFSAWG
jgi:GNAT superfamily N-acetyltransferase